MKYKYLITLCVCIFPLIVSSQGLINIGNNILVESGGIIHISSGNFTNSTQTTDGAVSLSGEIYVDGNWTNNTTGAILNLGGGTVYFDGTTPSTQQITHGIYRTKFYDLNIVSTATVEVPAQKEVEVSHDLYIGGTFTLKSTSDGTASLFYNGVCEENINVERYIKYDGTGSPYHYISSPVNDAAFSNIWTTGDYNVYYYDETNNSTNLDHGWTRMLGTTLTNAKGYAIPYDEQRTLLFIGDIDNSGDIEIDITYNQATTPDPNTDGWNLIGNPYPASLSVSTFISDNSNIVGCVYFYDDGNGTINRNNDYATYNITGGTATNAADDGNNMGEPNGKIAIGQGFFVQALNTVSSSPNTSFVTFTNSQKTSNTSSQYFIAEPFSGQRFWLGVNNPEQTYNEILLGFLPEATEGNDRLYDAPKLKGNPDLAFYSILEGRDYIIQGLPIIDNEPIQIKLGIDVGIEGNHELFLKKSENMEDVTSLILEDLYEKNLIDLKSSPSYTFNSEIGTFKDRFIVHINKEQSSILNSKVDLQPEVYLQGSVMNVKSFGLDINSIQIFLIDGKLIKDIKISHSNDMTFDFMDKKGNYIVRLNTDKNSFLKRITLL